VKHLSLVLRRRASAVLSLSKDERPMQAMSPRLSFEKPEVQAPQDEL
jgi:hypothetical protein